MLDEPKIAFAAFNVAVLAPEKLVLEALYLLGFICLPIKYQTV